MNDFVTGFAFDLFRARAPLVEVPIIAFRNNASNLVKAVSLSVLFHYIQKVSGPFSGLKSDQGIENGRHTLVLFVETMATRLNEEEWRFTVTGEEPNVLDWIPVKWPAR